MVLCQIRPEAIDHAGKFSSLLDFRFNTVGEALYSIGLDAHPSLQERETNVALGAWSG